MCSFVDSPLEASGGCFHDEWSQSSNLMLDEKRKFKEKGGGRKAAPHPPGIH